MTTPSPVGWYVEKRIKEGRVSVLSKRRLTLPFPLRGVEEVLSTLEKVGVVFAPGSPFFFMTASGTASLFYVGEDSLERYAEENFSLVSGPLEAGEPLGEEYHVKVQGTVEWASFKAKTGDEGEVLLLVTFFWQLNKREPVPVSFPVIPLSCLEKPVPSSLAEGRGEVSPVETGEVAPWFSFVVPVSLQVVTHFRAVVVAVAAMVEEWHLAELEDGYKLTGKLGIRVFYTLGSSRLYTKESEAPLYYWFSKAGKTGFPVKFVKEKKGYELKVQEIFVQNQKEEGTVPGKRLRLKLRIALALEPQMDEKRASSPSSTGFWLAAGNWPR